MNRLVKRTYIFLGLAATLMAANFFVIKYLGHIKLCHFEFFNELLNVNSPILDRCFNLKTLTHRLYLRSLELIWLFYLLPYVSGTKVSFPFNLYTAIRAVFFLECILILNISTPILQIQLVFASLLLTGISEYLLKHTERY